MRPSMARIFFAVVQRSPNGQHRIEGDAAYAAFYKLTPVAGGERGYAAEVVVYHAHIQPVAHLAPHDVQHRVEHLAVVDDEILRIDEFFRALHVAQHIRKHIVAEGIVFRALVCEHGRAGLFAQVGERLRKARLFGAYLAKYRAVVGRFVRRCGGEPARQRARRALVSEQQIQRRARQRERQYDQQPQRFVRRLLSLYDDVEHEKYGQYGENEVYHRRIRGQPAYQRHQQQHLYRKRRQNGYDPAHSPSHIKFSSLCLLV